MVSEAFRDLYLPGGRQFAATGSPGRSLQHLWEVEWEAVVGDADLQGRQAFGNTRFEAVTR